MGPAKAGPASPMKQRRRQQSDETRIPRIPRMHGPAAPKARVRWGHDVNPHAKEVRTACEFASWSHLSGLATPRLRQAAGPPLGS
jgi:hypothetical protein